MIIDKNTIALKMLLNKLKPSFSKIKKDIVYTMVIYKNLKNSSFKMIEIII